MTRDLQALRPVGNHLIITAAVVGALLLLGSEGAGRLFISPPDVVVQEVLGALSAHRDPAAHKELSQKLRADLPPEELERLAVEIEQRRGTVTQIDAETLGESPDRATVRATVRFQDGREEQLDLPLIKEQGSWRVDSVDPVRSLAGG